MGIRSSLALGAGLLAVTGFASLANAQSETWYFNDPGESGLSAQATFTLLDSTTLEVRLKNTSTGVPGGFSATDQILSGVSWDFGFAGPHFLDPLIIGGDVHTGPQSFSHNFDGPQGDVGGGFDVSGEFGYSNSNFTGLLQNFISSSQIQTTLFGGQNLDGATDIAGPEGGLISASFALGLSGNAAIEDEIVSVLDLSMPVNDLSFLTNNGTRVEFGDDTYFIAGSLVPAPGVLALLGLAGLAGTRRRRA